MNKSTKILICLLVFGSAIGQAQPRFFQEKKEQIKALKIGYITTELALTTDEASKFWPLFNAFEEKQQDIRQQKTKNFLARMDDEALNKMTDKEAQSLLAQLETTEDELFQLRKKFMNNLKSVLPSVKILKLKRAEDKFSKKLLQQYRKG